MTTLGVLVALSVRELRRLLARLVWPPPPTRPRCGPGRCGAADIRPAPAAHTSSVAGHSLTPSNKSAAVEPSFYRFVGLAT